MVGGIRDRGRGREERGPTPHCGTPLTEKEEVELLNRVDYSGWKVEEEEGASRDWGNWREEEKESVGAKISP